MKRLDYIDTSKGILIILVVLGHYIMLLPKEAPYAHYLYSMRTCLYYFHMPAFFVITGIIVNPIKWNDLGFKTFLKKRFIKLIIPYFIFEVLAGFSRMFLFHIPLKEAIYNTLSVKCNLGSNWFLVTLFFSEIIFYFTHKYGRMINILSSLLVIFIASITIPINENIRIIVLRIFMAWAFINFGFFAKQIWQYQNIYIMAICIIFLLISSVYKQHMEFWDVSISSPPVYIVRALVGTFATINFSRLININVLSICGINSLGIMLTHHLYKYYFEASGYFVTIPRFFLALFICSILIYASIKFFNKYFPVAIGKT